MAKNIPFFLFFFAGHRFFSRSVVYRLPRCAVLCTAVRRCGVPRCAVLYTAARSVVYCTVSVKLVCFLGPRLTLPHMTQHTTITRPQTRSSSMSVLRWTYIKETDLELLRWHHTLQYRYMAGPATGCPAQVARPSSLLLSILIQPSPRS